MKKIISNNFWLLVIIILIISVMFFKPTTYQTVSFNRTYIYDPVTEYLNNKDKVSYQKDTLILKLKTDNDDYRKQLEQKLNIEISNLNGETDVIKFNDTEYSTEEILTLLNNEDVVDYAEPDYVYKPVALPTTEPNYPYQWGLNDTDYGINILPVWEQTYGHGEAIVGVIDTGVNYNHPDLVNQIWHNEDEIAGNSIDDDGNGYVDDTIGWAFDTGNNNPMDLEGHGTHVSGIIAAGINDIGVVGVAPSVKIMPLNAANSKGELYLSSIISAVNYGLGHGVKIFNLSFGSSIYVQAFNDLIGSSNAIFICAAGNGGEDLIGDNNDTTPFYPASYDQNNIISVGAIDDTGELASFSNYGVNTVDIAAPGYSIMSTYLGTGYINMSGTSMAAPFVTGVAALIYSEDISTDVLNLKKHILDGVKILPSLSGKISGSNMINAQGAYNDYKSAAIFEGGNGSEADPFLISTPIQLDAIRNDLSASYRLLNNIDLTYDTTNVNGLFYNQGLGWNPIGIDSKAFIGNLDGAGKTIRGLSINNIGAGFSGLFGYVKNANVHDINIIDANINGGTATGAISGVTEGSAIANVLIDGSIRGKTYCGGIAGTVMSSIIQYTYNMANITGDESKTGGIAGWILQNSSISDSANAGLIYGALNTGGITSTATNSTIEKTYNVGAIAHKTFTEPTTLYIGGITSDANNSTIRNNYDLLDVSGSVDAIGLVGTGTTVTNTVQKTFSNLMLSATYIGFDFVNVWVMNTESLPTLQVIEENTTFIYSNTTIEGFYITELPLVCETTFNQIMSSNSLSDTYIKSKIVNIDETTNINIIDGLLKGSAVGQKKQFLILYGQEHTVILTVDATVTAILERIYSSSLPNKINYNIGESFDATGLVVVNGYNDGTTTPNEDYTLSGFDSSSAGTKTILLAYNELEYSFEVYVGSLIGEVKITEVSDSTLRISTLHSKTLNLEIVRKGITADTPVVAWASSDTSIFQVDPYDTSAGIAPIGRGTATLSVTVSTADDQKTIQTSIIIYNAGDLNDDSKATTTDLVLLRQSLAGLTSLDANNLACADLNQDGKVTTTDLILLRQSLAGLIGGYIE